MMRELFKKLYQGNIKELKEIIRERLEKEEKMFIVTANPESFMNQDSSFKQILNDPSVTLVADGISVVKAAKSLGIYIPERITGIDLTQELLTICEEKHYTLSLLGAKREVLEQLINVIKEKYPHISIGPCLHGYTRDDEREDFFKKIALEKVDVCLVALGIPEQEKLIYKHLNNLNKGIFIGVGGTFDVLSGQKKRAPKWMINLNLEWLYRIIKEPKRIKRFWQNNIVFLFKVKKLKRKD